jgi:transcriptional regulator with XRE-family HTH domain
MRKQCSETVRYMGLPSMRCRTLTEGDSEFCRRHRALRDRQDEAVGTLKALVVEEAKSPAKNENLLRSLRLRLLRAQMHWSQAETAVRAGVSQGVIRSAELGGKLWDVTRGKIDELLEKEVPLGKEILEVPMTKYEARKKRKKAEEAHDRQLLAEHVRSRIRSRDAWTPEELEAALREEGLAEFATPEFMVPIGAVQTGEELDEHEDDVRRGSPGGTDEGDPEA